MIDPRYMTNYNLDDNGLEEVAIFCVLVAGKNAMTTAKLMDEFLKTCGWKPHTKRGIKSPFMAIRQHLPFLYDNHMGLADELQAHGIGCHKMKGESLRQLAQSKIDLRKCSPEDLEKIHGIGPKTSRFFILHTRKDAQVACLDTHVLKWLRDQGFDAPKTTPGKKKYKELESLFLTMARAAGKTPADFDLEIWNKYAGHEEEVKNERKSRTGGDAGLASKKRVSSDRRRQPAKAGVSGRRSVKSHV